MSQRGRGRGRGRHYDHSDAPSFHRGRGGGRRGRGRNGGAPPSFPSESGPSQRGRGRAGGSGVVAPAPVQAPQPPAQAYAPPPPPTVQASSSSAPPSAVASSKAIGDLPARPGFGTLGTRIQVRANHFLVEFEKRDLHFHHYDVSITPEVTSKGTNNRDVIKQLVQLYKVSHLGNRTPTYDGMKGIFTAGPLPFAYKEFVVKLGERDGRDGSSGSKRENREFKVAVKLADIPYLCRLQQFLSSSQHESPQKAKQLLNVVLRAASSDKHTVIGRSFFAPELGLKGELGNGLEYWRGFYQSLRQKQFGLSLNIDVSASSFYEPILVTDFVKKHFDYVDLSRPLVDRDRLKVKKALKGVKVAVTYGHNRNYKITGVSTEPLSRLSFTSEDNRTLVVQYYQEKYKITLRNVAMPALQAGSDSKPFYLPMELCSIVAGQQYSRKLNGRQVAALLRATCERPNKRESHIKQMVKQSKFNEHELIEAEFGMQVREDMALVDARVLPPPLLKYHDHQGHETKVTPQMGQWNMINKKMVNGGKVDFWAFVNFSRLEEDFNIRFCDALVNMCNSKGMDFHAPSLIPKESADPEQIEEVLKNIHSKSTQRLEEIGQEKKHLQLLIIILPDVTGSYGMIKQICETELGIVSQCCQPGVAEKCKEQYLESLALKINVKVGGRNTILNDMHIHLDTNTPTIIIGADVSHPGPGDNSSPSIAAVVASMDWPGVSKYRGIVSAQAPREEIIQDLYCLHQDPDPQKCPVPGGMIREHFMAFKRSTGLKPAKIIFYRDGVDEDQFSQVRLYEMDAIRNACISLEEGYLPPVTFVVAQKRHHTRLFPADHNRHDPMNRSGNIQPGTVVDTKICHTREFDFFLNSHAGIQGTSRPVHYHVLYDENGFTADQLQSLTNNLCYTYARCTSSVSLVPPVYYAHLAAFRARYYIAGEVASTTASKTSHP